MVENGNITFHSKLKRAMDLYVHKTYDYSSIFPKEEIFGVTSQLRRVTLPIILNYVEGYARQRKAVLKHFLEIAYGSLRESEYLISFAPQRNYMKKDNFDGLQKLSNEIGAMLWGIISKLR